MCVYRWAGLYICVCGRASDGVWVNVQCLCTRACVCVQTYIYMKASKERAPAGREERTERESRPIKEMRVSKGRNCQPGGETDNKLSSSGG